MGNWIQTYSGKKVDPLNLKPEDVEIIDIAHSLALTCRFTGHCPEFYSVAQHSVLVSQHCPTEKLWGLLHDAPEAYMADISRPVKQGIRDKHGQILDNIEWSIMEAIIKKFNLPEPKDGRSTPKEVLDADLQMLLTEGKHFFGKTKMYYEWESLYGNNTIQPSTIVCWTWQQAEEAFLQAFMELTK